MTILLFIDNLLARPHLIFIMIQVIVNALLAIKGINMVTTSLRLDVHRSTGGNTGLVEFAVYGTPVGD
ncbi:MAG: hypothetical protein KAS61_06805 [Spirochaetes bacterium]|nr:hypothetical protein [Spirochaetota bacterium]